MAVVRDPMTVAATAVALVVMWVAAKDLRMVAAMVAWKVQKWVY
jgi:hypothetical protein